MHVVPEYKMVKRFWRRRPPQDPTTDFVFEKINGRHRQEKDVVKIRRDRCRHFVRSTYPRDRDRQEGLQTVERREAEKKSDRRAHRDRVRCVGHRDQRHVMLS